MGVEVEVVAHMVVVAAVVTHQAVDTLPAPWVRVASTATGLPHMYVHTHADARALRHQRAYSLAAWEAFVDGLFVKRAPTFFLCMQRP